MNTRSCVEALVGRGQIPDDAEVVSTNNKVVIISRNTRIVARIGNLAELKSRDDPHDLRYSHRVSWLTAAVAPAVEPLEEEPIMSGEYIISRYPLLNDDVRLTRANAGEVFAMTRQLGDALPDVQAGMTLRRIDMTGYVGERLDHMRDNPEHDARLVAYIDEEVDRMSREHPFAELVEGDKALIHGDFKIENVVSDDAGTLKAIDLDAASIGPRLYDLASWRLRRELGDKAPIEDVVEVGRRTHGWDEEAYRALIGWKAISSMSFTLRYEAAEVSTNKVAHISRSAVSLGGLSTPLK